MKSAGIPDDIDLTLNREFRHGVDHCLAENEHTPNVLPWNKDGTPKHNVGYSGNYISIVNSDDELLWSTTIINKRRHVDLYLETMNTWNNTGWTPEKVRYHTIGEDDVDISHIKLSTNPEDVRKYLPMHDIYATHRGVFVRGITFGKSCNWSCKMYTDDYVVYDTAYSDPPADITPSEFILAKLTEKELSGESLICGHGIELYDKTKFRNYILAVQKIIEEEGPHRPGLPLVKCVDCGSMVALEENRRCHKCNAIWKMTPRSYGRLPSMKEFGKTEMRGDVESQRYLFPRYDYFQHPKPDVKGDLFFQRDANGRLHHPYTADWFKDYGGNKRYIEIIDDIIEEHLTAEGWV